MKTNNIYRPTFCEVSPAALKNNLSKVRKKLSPKTKILPIIKAAAYGHGMTQIAAILAKDGIKSFGVATLDEAMELRAAFPKAGILLLGSIYPFENLKVCHENNITPTIASLDVLRWFDVYLKRKNAKFNVHVKVDTGMNRIGFSHERLKYKMTEFGRMKNVLYEGIYSHLACGDEDGDYNDFQLDNFDYSVKIFQQAGINFKYRHIANSAAILCNRKSHYDMVRPGLLLYGLLPFEGAQKLIKTTPVMTVLSKIVFLKWIKKESRISYGGKFIAPHDMYIATIPIGYADGYRRILSNLGYVIIRGEKCFVTGRVCMDMIMADVTAIKDAVRVGENVTVMGGEMSAEKMAYLTGTVNYEVTCGFSKRVPRVESRE